MTVTKSVKEIENQILKWCTDENLFHKKIRDDKSHFLFQLKYPENSQFTTTLAVPKNKEDLILLFAGINVHQDSQNKMKTEKKKTMENFIYELRMLLCDRSTTFNLSYPDNIVDKFEIHYPIFFDGLTKNSFMNGLSEIHKTRLLGIWFINNKFGVEKDKKDETSNIMFG